MSVANTIKASFLLSAGAANSNQLTQPSPSQTDKESIVIPFPAAAPSTLNRGLKLPTPVRKLPVARNLYEANYIKYIAPERYDRDTVRTLQGFLTALKLGDGLGTTGPHHDGVDGDFGEKTEQAVLAAIALFPPDAQANTPQTLLARLEAECKKCTGLDKLT